MGLAGKKKKLFDDQYEILSIVGRGSRSVVYHARTATGTQEEVALKVLLSPQRDDASSLTVREHLSNEALAMIGARHQYVLRLNDFQSVQDLSYLSLQYAPLRDLLAYTKARGGRLDPRQGDRFFRQAVDAFHYIHSVGILHRDIKPDNVLVISDEEIRISDFGIARLPGSHERPVEPTVGTMSYLSPELLEGEEHSAYSDIYALGLTFYELFVGHHPFDNVPPIHQLDARRSLKHISVACPEVPVRLGDLIMGCLEFHKGDRIKSFREILVELAAFDYDSGFQSRSEAPAASNTDTRTSTIPADPADSAPPVQYGHSRVPQTDAPVQLQNKEEFTEQELIETKPHFIKAAVSEVESVPPATVMRSFEKAPVVADSEDLDEDGGRSYASPTTGAMRYPLYEKGKSAPQTPSRQSEKKDSESPVETQEQRSQKRREKKREVAAPMERTGQKQRKQGTQRRVRLLRLIVLAFLVGLATAALLYTSTGVMNKKSNAPQSNKAQTSFFPSSSLPEDGLQFSTLPAGVYTGTVTGVIPSRALPLTLIADGQEDVTVILGLDGAMPVTVKRDQAAKGFRYTSGGLVLRFLPQDGKELRGTVENVIGKEQGEWSVAPRR